MRAKDIRRLDGQGRVILPSHIRKAMNLSTDSAVTIDMTEDGKIIIAPALDRCCICGKTVTFSPFTRTITVGHENKYVCGNCFAGLRDREV